MCFAGVCVGDYWKYIVCVCFCCRGAATGLHLNERVYTNGHANQLHVNKVDSFSARLLVWFRCDCVRLGLDAREFSGLFSGGLNVNVSALRTQLLWTVCVFDNCNLSSLCARALCGSTRWSICIRIVSAFTRHHLNTLLPSAR